MAVLCPPSTACPLAIHLHLAIQPLAGKGKYQKIPFQWLGLWLEVTSKRKD